MPHVAPSVSLSPEVVPSPEVHAALAAGRAVVALESTLLAHGLPAPHNRVAADELEAAVRARGAVPATVAVLDGVPRVGLSAAELDRVCGGDLVKLSMRDLGSTRRRGPRGWPRWPRRGRPGSARRSIRRPPRP